MRRAAGLLRWLLPLLILVFLGGHLLRHPEDWSVLGEVEASALLVLCLLQAAAFTVQGVQLQVVIEAVSGVAVGRLAWQRIFWISRLLNFFLPQTGTAYRAMRLKDTFGVALTDYAGGFILFLWLSILISTGLALVMVALFEPALALYGMDARLLLLLLFAGLLAPPLALPGMARLPLPGRLGLLTRLQTRCAGAAALARGILSSPRFLLRYGLSTAISTALGAAIMMQSFAVFGVELPIGAAILIFALLSLAWLVPVVPGNLGVLELICGALAAGLGLTLTVGVLVSALIRVSGLAVMAVVGLPAGTLDAFDRARAAGQPAVPASPPRAVGSASIRGGEAKTHGG